MGQTATRSTVINMRQFMCKHFCILLLAFIFTCQTIHGITTIPVSPVSDTPHHERINEAQPGASVTTSVTIGEGLSSLPPRFGQVPLSLATDVPPLPMLEREQVRVLNNDGEVTLDVTAAHCLAPKFIDVAPNGSLVTSELTPPLDPVLREYLRDLAVRMANNETSIELRRWLAIVGHNRSGSTLLGSLLDAHPNIGVGNEANAVSRAALYSAMMSALGSPGQLVSFAQAQHPVPRAWLLELALRSFYPCGHGRLQQEFNYRVPGQWQGRWRGECPSVLGDKNTDNLVRAEYRRNLTLGLHHLGMLHASAGVPFVYVQVMRNPLDVITTEFLRDVHESLWWLNNLTQYRAAIVARSAVVQHIVEEAGKLKFSLVPDAAHTVQNLLHHHVRLYFQRFDQVQRYRSRFPLHQTDPTSVPLLCPDWGRADVWVDMYLDDLADNTPQQLKRLCDALHVECSNAYLKACREVVNPTVNRRAHLLSWPQNLLHVVHQLVSTRGLLQRYADDILFT